MCALLKKIRVRTMVCKVFVKFFLTMTIFMVTAREEQQQIRAVQRGPHEWFVWDVGERTLGNRDVFIKLVELLKANHYKFAYNSDLRTVCFGELSSAFYLRGQWVSVNQ